MKKLLNLKKFNILLRSAQAALFLIVVFLASCEKDIGTGVGLFSDTNLSVNVVDSFYVKSTPVFENTVKSSGYEDVLLGSYIDPFFGVTRASFYGQFLTELTGVFIDQGNICDSVVFYAKLGTDNGIFYGTENKEMTFNVYRINNDADFNQNKIYYTNSSLPVYNQSLLDPAFDNTFLPNFDDTVQIGLDTNNVFTGVLQLHLKPGFGQEILNFAGTDVLRRRTEFLKIYQGLYVTTEENDDGSILSIDYGSNATTMVLYYHNPDTTGYITFQMTISQSGHFNRIIHDYENTASPEFHEIIQNPEMADRKYFLQAGSGYSVDLAFPTLKALKDSVPLLPINKAELILPVDTSFFDGLGAGLQLFISRLDENGVEYTIADQGSVLLDGRYNSFRQEYRFNITRHIANFFNEKLPSPDVRVKMGKTGYSVNRVIMNGNKIDTANGVKNLKLRIYYSSLTEGDE